MTPKEITRRSRLLSLVLRHQPEVIELQLDERGWTRIDHLLEQLAAHGNPTTRTELEQIVTDNDKQRFTFSEDGHRIRANQGHSIPIDLHLPPATPPDILYHGTATRFLTSIMAEGLRPGSRQHVHLSLDRNTATAVGNRHGRAIILTVDAASMVAAGHVFFVSKNGVWLTDSVPREFLTL